MATSDSREVVIEATPEEILAVVADVESAPTWASQYQKAEIIESDDQGRPRVVKQTVKTVGITDVLTVEYTWEENKVSWELLKASQLKTQKCSYTLTPLAGAEPRTRVRFDITVDLAIPLPGFLLKKVMKGAIDVATDGLRKQVLKVKKT